MVQIPEYPMGSVMIGKKLGLNPKSEIGTAHLTQSFGHPWFETGCGVLI
jgi:hypothetical protein